MVHAAAWQAASGRDEPQAAGERGALWIGVLRSLGGSTD
jgi:hypothetical protein